MVLLCCFWASMWGCVQLCSLWSSTQGRGTVMLLGYGLCATTVDASVVKHAAVGYLVCGFNAFLSLWLMWLFCC